MESEHIPGFKHLPRMEKKLIEFGIVKSFAENEVIMQEDSFIQAIPIVLKGTIRVMRSDETGREILLYYIRPGESCIMSFLGGVQHQTSKVHAQAEENTEILFIPVDVIPDFIREYPEWLDYIFKLYHKRFEELLQVVNDIAFRKTDERLLDLIRKKASINDLHTIQVTHEQLASELGTNRVVVSRLLKNLEEEGKLTLGRNRISLKNMN